MPGKIEHHERGALPLDGRRIGPWRERRGHPPEGFLTVQDAFEQSQVV
jgi:hypothetical protein